MTKTYSHSDSNRVRWLLEALLPFGVSCTTSVLNGGLTLSVSICGPISCRTYEYRSQNSENDFIQLAKAWSTGDFKPPETYSGRHAVALASPITEITSREAFFLWFKPAHRGAKIVYFKGRLAQYRHDAQKRLVTLQGLADNARPARPRPTSERIELVQLQEQSYLLQEINRLHSMNKIELTQGKMLNDTGNIYYAVKK